MQKYFDQSFKGEARGTTRGETSRVFPGAQQDGRKWGQCVRDWLETGSRADLPWHSQSWSFRMPHLHWPLPPHLLFSFYIHTHFLYLIVHSLDFKKTPNFYELQTPLNPGPPPGGTVLYKREQWKRRVSVGWGKIAVIHPSNLWQKRREKINTMLW